MKTYQESEHQYYSDSRAKLFRDEDNRQIAGVCAGLGRYFGLETSLIRIVWFLLGFIGIFSAKISTFMVIMVYVILWIIVPKGRTVRNFEAKR